MRKLKNILKGTSHTQIIKMNNQQENYKLGLFLLAVHIIDLPGFPIIFINEWSSLDSAGRPEILIQICKPKPRQQASGYG